MLKNNSGVTILALVITLLILVILTGVSINTGFFSINEMRVGRMISSMTMVRAKVETIYEKYQFDGILDDLVGTEVANIEIELSDEEKDLLGNEIQNWKWYKWDSNILETQGLDKEMLGKDNYFLVNYEHAEILCSTGASLNKDITYYSLTGLEYTLEND